MSSVHSTRDVISYATAYIRGAVLDVGGGTSKYKSIILASARQYACIDAVPGASVDVVGDVLNMPFEDMKFDTVICNQVFEHVDDPEGLMREIARVLRPGGHAIITAPFIQPVHADPGDYFRYTPEGIVALAERHGLTAVEKGKYGGMWVLLSSFLKFWLFNPYRKQSRIKKFLYRRIDRILQWLDRWAHPHKVFSDSYAILLKS